MTLPGIPPSITAPSRFQRTARGDVRVRYGSGGKDRFDVTGPLYRYLQRAIALRREHRLFSRGTPTVLKANRAAPVPWSIAWRIRAKRPSSRSTPPITTACSTISTPTACRNPVAGLVRNRRHARDLTVADDGRVHLRLPPRSGWSGWSEKMSSRTGVAIAPTLDALANDRITTISKSQVPRAASATCNWWSTAISRMRRASCRIATVAGAPWSIPGAWSIPHRARTGGMARGDRHRIGEQEVPGRTRLAPACRSG